MRSVFSRRGGERRLSEVEEAERAVKKIEVEIRGLFGKIDHVRYMRDGVHVDSDEYQELSRQIEELNAQYIGKDDLRVDMNARIARLKAEAWGGGMWRQVVDRVGSALRSERGRGAESGQLHGASSQAIRREGMILRQIGRDLDLVSAKGPSRRLLWVSYQDPRFGPINHGAAGARRLETGPGLGRHVGPVAAEVSSDFYRAGGGLGNRR
jgi:hypothetical protein